MQLEEKNWYPFQVDPRYRGHELYVNGCVYHHTLKKEGEGFPGAGHPRVIDTRELCSRSGSPDWMKREIFMLMGQGREFDGKYKWFNNPRLRITLKGDVERFLHSTTRLYELIDHVELDVGGQRLDRLQNWELQMEAARLGRYCAIVNDIGVTEITVELPILFDLLTGDKFFSRLQNHETRLNVEFARQPFEGLEFVDATVMIDIIDLPDASSEVFKEPGYNLSWEGMMLQSQFTGEVCVRFNESNYISKSKKRESFWKLRLNFNHPLLYMGLVFKFGGVMVPEEHCRKVFNSIAILMNGEHWNTWKSEDLIVVGGALLIPLMRSEFMGDLDPYGVEVNASQVDNLEMRIYYNKSFKDMLKESTTTTVTRSAEWMEEPVVETREDNSVVFSVLLTARSHQMLRSMSGMAGLAYSK